MMFHFSKKVAAAVVSAVVVLVNSALGSPVSDDQIAMIVGVVVAYMVSQGIADHGNQGAVTAARRAAKKGAEVPCAVSAVLEKNAGSGASDEEDGPGWEDTSDVDPDDKKELLG